MSDTLLIIDGNSLVHRAFHALPLLSTTRGVITNAVYGFVNMLLKALAEHPVQFVAVCFDKGKINFRHSDYKEYKANRKATPEELRGQFPLIKEFLGIMGIQILECENYEADDLIGALVEKAEKAKISSIILTGDQDILQLVSPQTKVLLTRKGITELEDYTEGKVWERFGVTPLQFADYKGLTGDKSDNIPGVPGIGPKSAAALLKEYGSLDNIINHNKELPGRYREKINVYAEQAILSKRLATIKKEAPIAINPTQFRSIEPNYPELMSFFNKMEFKTLLRSLRQPEKAGKKKRTEKTREKGIFDSPDIDVYLVGYQEIKEAESASDLLSAVRRAERVAITVNAGGGEVGVQEAALALMIPGQEAQEKEIQVAYLTLDDQFKLETMREICEDPDIQKLVHNGKNMIQSLSANRIALRGLSFDTMIAAYLNNPGSPSPDLPDLALDNLKVVLPAQGPSALASQAEAVYKLSGILETRLCHTEIDRLFHEVEMPLVSILAEMEMTGIALDTSRLTLMSKDLGQKIQEVAAWIYQLAGEEFNINSPKQLAYILFEKLQLPVIKRKKTGYSTDVEVLQELAGIHPLAGITLEYRQLVKLKSTYVDSLASLVNPSTGLVYTTFNQTVTATGRLSSSEPNLQNIPVRLEEGRKIRQVFIPRQKENVILAADYSQIELRVLAHMSGDPGLVEAFLKGDDIHTRTAAEVFSISVENVTKAMRARAKAVNFGIVYGLSDFGLARDINSTRQEAKQYIENYFNRYKGVKAYIERTINEAREKGYVTTLLNRRRYLPDLFSTNRIVRNFGERTAVNTPIQGSAADIIKLAMIRIDQELKRRGVKAKMILQVHDELIFDVPLPELDEVAGLVRECMENAIILDVPVIADLKMGPNWYELKPL